MLKRRGAEIGEEHEIGIKSWREEDEKIKKDKERERK